MTGLINPFMSFPGGGGPGPGPSPEGVYFDGADSASRGAQLDGAFDTAQFLYYIKFRTTASGTRYMSHVDGNKVQIYQSTNNIVAILRSTSPMLLQLTTSGFLIRDGLWHDFFLEYNGASTGSALAYLDDTDVTGTPSTLAGGSVDLTRPNFAIGSTTANASYFLGDIERVAMWDDALPGINSQSVRDDIRNHANAATIGNNIVDCYGSASDWNAGVANRGTGGAFTVSGSLDPSAP